MKALRFETRAGFRSLACAAVASMFAAPVFSATIFRCVDDRGRTHVADAVPAGCKGRVERIDTQRWQLPVERAEAAQRELARLCAQLDAPQFERDEAAPPVRGTAPAATSAPRRSELADCGALRRAYAASQACFAPFQNVNGTMKPGAFEACVELPDPSPVCGIATAPR